MADTAQLEIEIVLADGSVTKAFTNLDKIVDKAATKVGQTASKGAAEGFQQGLSGLLGGGLGKLTGILAGVGAAFVAAFSAREAIQGAIESENAINRLNQALASAGTFSQAASQTIQDFASEVQKTTGIQDEFVLSLTATARAFTRTNEEALAVTRAALDLSAATGVDADSAVKALSQSLNGNGAALGRILPQVRALTAEQLKAGDAVKLVQDRFNGFAQASAQTFSGSLSRLSANFGEVLETIGKLVVNSPTLTKVIGFISDQFARLGEFLSRSLAGVDIFKPIVESAILVARGINAFVITPLEVVFRLAQTIFNSLQTALSAATSGFLTILAKIQSGLALVGLGSENTAKQFEALADQAAERAANGLNNVADSIEAVRAQSFSNGLDKLINDFEEAALVSANTAAVIQNNSTQTAAVVSQNLAATTAATQAELAKQQQLYQQLASFISSAFVGTISAGLQRLGAALIVGQEAFGDFRSVILNIIGDLLIQVGQGLLVQGLAIEALAVALATLLPGAGLAAAAAGAGLIVAGGAIKAAAGGGGGGGGGVAGSAPVGDTGQAVTGAPQPVTNEPGISDAALNAEREPTTQIAVNVQGDVLDSEESGLRIVDILQNAFDKNGAVLVGSGSI